MSKRFQSNHKSVSNIVSDLNEVLCFKKEWHEYMNNVIVFHLHLFKFMFFMTMINCTA